MKDYQNTAILSVRLIGLLVFVWGLCLLLANIFESVSELNPTYLSYFIMSQLIRPLIACGFGVALLCFSRRLGEIIAKGLDKE